jgi:outer membrane receptor protein involved in Fe transport
MLKARLCGLVALAGFVFCTTAAALAQIAPGVTQSAAHTANIIGTVRSSSGEPVAGAEIRLSGSTTRSAKSDARGLFSFRSVPWGTYEITVTSSLGTASRSNIILAGDIDVAIQYQPSGNLRTIAHVSTSSAGAHINVTSSSITSISPSQSAFEGTATWGQLFAQVPGVAASGATNGGDHAFQTVPGAPEAPVVLSLNGALPYETATSLDGMPLIGNSASIGFGNAGAGFDLSNLPINAFDTADVVRGPGANAPSIVDSVGGTFVLHGPGQVAGTHFEVSAGNDQYGGIVSNALFAARLGRLSATLIYGINDSPGPMGTKYGMVAFVRPGSIGGQLVRSSTFTVETCGGVPNTFCSLTGSLLYCCGFQSTAWTVHNGAVALSYDIGQSVTAQLFYAGSSTTQAYEFGELGFDFAPSPATPPYKGNIPASPLGQANYAFPDLLFQGLYDIQSSRLLEERITAYVGRGVLRLGALQNASFDSLGPGLDGGFSNGNYQVWGTACVGAAAPSSTCPAGGTSTAYNGTSEALTFNALGYGTTSWSSNRDLMASYAMQIGSATSAGVSYVKSYYDSPYAESVSLGGTPIFSLSYPSGASQTTDETRVNVDSYVSDNLNLSLSWYFAQATYHLPAASNHNTWANYEFPYSAPRVGAVWMVNQNTAVRAAVGGGYALPSLSDLIGTPLTLVGPYYYEAIPTSAIKPEEAFGFDLGTDMRLRSDTVLSFDLYRTNLYGQFFTSTSQSTLKGLPLYLSEFGNLGTSRMEGINLDVRRDVSSGYYWRATLGFTRGFVVSVPPGFYDGHGCTNCANQAIVPGLNFNSAAGYGVTVPYASASAQLGYRWKPGTYLDLSSTYYGNNNIYYTPRAFVELDAHAGYAFTKHVSLLLWFSNLTGVYDQSFQRFQLSYAVPVIAGAPPYSPGGAYELPYGPRSVMATVNFKY